MELRFGKDAKLSTSSSDGAMAGFEAFHRPGQKTFGFWGNHTSSLDWCEDNYTHSHLIAEFWNTTSNIPFIVLGVWGMLMTKGLPNRSRYLLAHSFLVTIGVGSAVFHGTLKWHAQVLLDELPMIWSAAVFMYIAISGGDERPSWRLKLFCCILPFVISWAYLHYPNPVFHQVCFASMELVSVGRGIAMMKQVPEDTPERRRKKKECSRNFIRGVCTFALGFGIWNLDNLLCDGLTALRISQRAGVMGELLGMMTQGHAWWHILTGIGSSEIVNALSYLVIMLHQPDDFEFGYAFGLPYVRRIVSKKAA